MRIAISTLAENTKSPTGLLSYFLQLAKYLPLAAPEHEFIFIVPDDEVAYYSDRIRACEVVAGGWGNSNRLLRMASEHFGLASTLKKLRADLLYYCGAGTAPLYLPASSRLVLNVIATQHINPESFPEEARLSFARRTYRRALTGHSLRRADTVIVNSAFSAQIIEGAFPNLRRPIEVVHHGVDRKLFNDAPATEAEASALKARGVGSPYVLFVGKVYKYKLLHVLAFAFCQTVSANALPHKLVVMGSFSGPLEMGDAYKERIRTIFAAAGLADRLILLDKVDVKLLRTLYAEASVYVQSSVSETFGRTTIEAMACGTPVLAAQAAATPEVLGDAGLYYDGANAEDCAAQLTRLLRDEPLRAQLSKLGRERAASLFTFEAEIARLSACFAATGGSRTARGKAAAVPSTSKY